MTLKSWVLDRVQRMNALASRADLPARGWAHHEPGLESNASEARPRAGRALSAEAQDSMLSAAEHLGAYAALIGAIRDELEHFVASQVRLHLAIAERDRFLLTSIGVRCPGGAEARQLLQQFVHEFKPEQVKRYLAREVIAALPNAAAIDLTQFAGLFDADARDQAEVVGEYGDLLAALRITPVKTAISAFQVSVVGRWSELELARPAAAASAPASATPTTPLAGRRCEFDIEDADGRRSVVLQSVVPGRRYLVGKGEGCDLRVNASYASRRHAEIWLDNDTWWVTDAGSTNGLRVESPAGRLDRSGPATAAAANEQPIRLVEGARVVLSARAEGPAADYPWVAIRSPAAAAARITPIATATGAPRTPLTAILPLPDAETVLEISAALVSGARKLQLRPSTLPVTVGRSRNQTLRVDRQHQGVSGHHLAITEIDDSSAEVQVHGDNGVCVDGVAHAAGTRLRWKVGETMELGASPQDHPACSLTLTRPGSH